MVFTCKWVWPRNATTTDHRLIYKAQPIVCSRRQFQFFFCFFKITNKARYFMRIVCQQTILMKYYTLFGEIMKNVATFIVCCSRDWRFRANQWCPEKDISTHTTNTHDCKEEHILSITNQLSLPQKDRSQTRKDKRI